MNTIYKTYGELSGQETYGDSVLTIQSFDHKKKLIKDNYLLVIDVFGDHCLPCKESMPKFAELAKKYNSPGICSLVKEDVSNGFTNTNTVPCFVFYLHGNLSPFHIINGADIPEIERIIQIVLSKR